MIPQRKQVRIRSTKTMLPSAALYKINCGLSSMELIIKAASQSSRTPLREKEAAMGIVPYMHSGEAMPKSWIRRFPKSPVFFDPEPLLFCGCGPSETPIPRTPKPCPAPSTRKSGGTAHQSNTTDKLPLAAGHPLHIPPFPRICAYQLLAIS